MDEDLRREVVQVRSRPRVTPPWTGTGAKKGGPVSITVGKRKRKRTWTREEAITALQVWAQAHGGRAPRQHELGRHAEPPLPSTHHIQDHGGLRELVVAAGLPPAPKGAGSSRRSKQNGGEEVDYDEAAHRRASLPAPLPAPAEPPAAEAPTDDVTPLQKLAADLKEAEAVEEKYRAPYIKARDDAQLIRLEMIELLQTEAADRGTP